MEEDYSRRFGAPGTVLYPLRSPAPDNLPPAGRTVGSRSALVVAYAGNIFNLGNWSALHKVAVGLRSLGGSLLLFGPMTWDDCRRNGLTQSNVHLRGFLDEAALARALREEADVLFLPMTFDETEKRNMQLCFPSKLADYTASMLPLLIYGPEYCSAVRWAREHPGVAEVVTEQGQDQIETALQRFADPEFRATLGARAAEAGDNFFSHDVGRTVFESALSVREARVAVTGNLDRPDLAQGCR